ncbi:MAG: amino acid ABC transporter substrate-binding protein [Candidatus Dadabacteria bacterium]|nr:MAG: amino acid ABC transporter substrate-binding protein [Candidatus Dadabacteria bacterium]
MKLLAWVVLWVLLFPVAVISEEIQIPAMVGLTGASANFGKVELDAYRLAVEEWNAKGGIKGKKVTLKVEDTQTSQKQIVTSFYRIAAWKPPVILGPTWLDTYQAVIPVARRENILLVTPSAAIEAFSKENKTWPISFYHNTTEETKVLVKGLKRKGFKKIALIYEEGPFAEMIRRLVLKNVSNLLVDTGIQGGETEFISILAKLRKKKPDVLLVFVWDESSLLSLLKNLSIYLPNLYLATIHDGGGWLKNPTFKPYLSHLIFTKFVITDTSFEARFEKRFGYKPMLTASNAYDAINAVLLAISAGNNTATQIRQYLTTKKLKTVTFGKFKFNMDGSVPSKVVLVDSSTLNQ